MRWFKHLSDSHSDPDLMIAHDKFGDFGVAGFWLILELYAKEFDKADPGGWVTLSCTEVKQKLRKRWVRVELLLNYFSTCRRFEFDYNEPYLKLRIPKFAELADNFTKRSTKSLRSRYEVTTKSVRPKNKNENKSKNENDIGRINTPNVIAEEPFLTAPAQPDEEPVKVFLKEWGDTWSEKVGQGKTYFCNFKKDTVIAKELLKIYPMDELRVLRSRFFESDDPFIRQSGYTIGVFKTQIPKLIANKNQKGETEKWIEDFSAKS